MGWLLLFTAISLNTGGVFVMPPLSFATKAQCERAGESLEAKIAERLDAVAGAWQCLDRTGEVV